VNRIFGDRTVRLAVTGLSGSGKTAFITSAIENLIAAAAKPARLPFLRAAAEGRLVAVRTKARREETGTAFLLKETFAALAADPPRWPASTTDLRQADLSVRFYPSRLLSLANPLARLTRRPVHMTIQILDYPGEWLLDLPLLHQSYEYWSRMTLEQAAHGVRAPLARDWLGFLDRHPPHSPSDAQTAQTAHELYRSYLSACRNSEQLTLLQPGRFLNPGKAARDLNLVFCPMPATGVKPPIGSLAAVMASRFEAYKRDVVRPFFMQLARDVDRQIVLVDVFRALNAGREAFADQRQSLDGILSAFRFGRGGLLRLWFGARIDRVLFAATKADHVPALQRDHLEALMSDMASVPALRAERAHSRVAATALASVRCTEDGTDEINGRKVDVVVGLPQGGDRRIHFFPGVVPMRTPPDAFWGDRFTEFPVFQPPRVRHFNSDGIPHINLDKALDFLLEDMLA
jgi:hypothetical protein